MNKKDERFVTFEKIVSLTKRRGFVYPSSEIYGGFAGVYDYGPMGAELAHNIKTLWWREMVQRQANIVGLNSSIFMHPKVWEASGHVSNFTDPLVECKKCNLRSRADHMLNDIGIEVDEKTSLTEINKLFDTHKNKLLCPQCKKCDFSEVRKFNLLVESNLGNFTGGGEPAYLRGETAQGIYVNYKNILDTLHLKIPFGVAQIGRVFRNEITPRQFLFRVREFEQMEMQYFSTPETAMDEFERFKNFRMEHLLSIGFKKGNLRFEKHKELIFYAKEAFDIEYNYPFGWRELEGIHARGDYDLTQHSEQSGTDLSYTDPESGKKFIPNVTETSVGVGRLMFALLCDAYDEEAVKGESRIVLRLKPEVAPIKIAILPLSNKKELIDGAIPIFATLKEIYMCQFDQTQSIGKRYRRQDEIGTPYCITYDFDSIKDKSVTVRDRDSMKQDRIKIEELINYFIEKFK